MFKKYNDTPAAIAIGLVTIFFNVMLIGQIGGVIGNLIEIATDATTADPVFLVLSIIFAALYCFGYFRLRSRL